MKSNTKTILEEDTAQTEEMQNSNIFLNETFKEYSQDPKIIRKQLIQVKENTHRKSKFFEKLGT